jgi:creatinine amidohydrolase/Fe(II)-dependent formamide hydrolase-like protein
MLEQADRITEAVDRADAAFAAALEVAANHQSEVEQMLAAHHAAEREDQASWTLNPEDAADARARADVRYEDQMRRSGARLARLRKHLTSFAGTSVPPGGSNSQEN